MANSPKPSVLQYLGLLAAGVASFYLAIHLGRPAASDDTDVDLLPKPRRTAPSASEAANANPSVNQTIHISAADQERVRLDPLVLRDAFSPLDPSVTVESLLPPPPRPMVLPANKPVSRKPKKKAPEPPPPPPPPPVVIVPPPAPIAPPFPFKFLGALQGERIGNGEMTVFVTGASGKVLLLKTGDVIDNTYKVKNVGPGKIEFIYLPLQTTQSLTIEK